MIRALADVVLFSGEFGFFSNEVRIRFIGVRVRVHQDPDLRFREDSIAAVVPPIVGREEGGSRQGNHAVTSKLAVEGGGRRSPLPDPMVVSPPKRGEGGGVAGKADGTLEETREEGKGSGDNCPEKERVRIRVS